MQIYHDVCKKSKDANSFVLSLRPQGHESQTNILNRKHQGHIARTRDESTPWWSQRQGAPPGAPNVVIIYMDDLGYSDPGCYGSEIDTPHIDALAARGQLFTHYSTHPICSPARAALLTGRNAHAVGTGWLSNANAGFPGYTGEIPLDVPTLAETFQAAGYETLMTGKWHNTPTLDTVPSAPKHNWPTQRGFDNFYGFMEGETHFFFPSRLQQNNQLLPIDAYPPDYYATDDWTNKSIQYLKELRASSADKPFFLYLAHNAVHAPLQSKPADLAKYRGRYDEGWTELRARRFRRQLEMGLVPEGTRLPESDPRVPPWRDTDPADRKLFARHMETYAAMLDCVDQNLGKLVACLEQLGELNNTIIVFTSDNGGTDGGEATGMFNNNRRYMGLPPTPVQWDRARVDQLGGPRSVSLYPTGWGEVCNTPFPSFKTYTGAGGRRVSFVVSWPSGLRDQGVMRRQFIHVTDIMPTLLELTGVAALSEVNGKSAQAMDGLSFAEALRSNEPAPRTEQYYECWANRAFYRGGWLARSIQKRGQPINMDNWTLHNLEEDFSEATDVSHQHPDKLAELVDAFDQAAWENTVYPLDNRNRLQKFSDLSEEQKAASDHPRTFLPGTQTIHRADILPLVADRSFTISLHFTSKSGDQGVLWALGDPIGGMVLYLENGELGFHYNGFGEETSFPPVPLPPRSHEVTLDYEALGGRLGRGRLLVDAVEAVAWTDLSPTLAFGIFEGLDIGLDRRGPVSWPLYERHGAFPFTGKIKYLHLVPGQRTNS